MSRCEETSGWKRAPEYTVPIPNYQLVHFHYLRYLLVPHFMT